MDESRAPGLISLLFKGGDAIRAGVRRERISSPALIAPAHWTLFSCSATVMAMMWIAVK